jgi:hypothetical protein
VLLAAPAALAGGWAVTTLDELPATLQAGQTHAVGYTIRQHGQTPLVTSHSGIEIRNAATGARERFAGTADGPQGHYVAQMRFPAAGEREWTADQSPFQPQALGTITIVAAAAPQPAPAVAVQPAGAAVEPAAGAARSAVVAEPVPAPSAQAPAPPSRTRGPRRCTSACPS